MIKCSFDNTTHYLRSDSVTPVPRWKLVLVAGERKHLIDQMTVDLNVFKEATGGWVSEQTNPEHSLFLSTIFFPSLASAQSAHRRLQSNPRLAHVFAPTRTLQENQLSPCSETLMSSERGS